MSLTCLRIVLVKECWQPMLTVSPAWNLFHVDLWVSRALPQFVSVADL